MIDLHCHMIPHIDDGASSPVVAQRMARLALAEGITTTACTPHIYPSVFENDRTSILAGVARLRDLLAEADIPLRLTHGADIQIVPDLVQGLRSKHMVSLNDSRYFLFEPPHFSVPHAFSRLVFDCLAAGYVPVITHPERLQWLEERYYDWFVDAALDGAWIQITADAITGRFGKQARYWSERFLADGVVHILATDAHDDYHRPPSLSAGRKAAERFVGAAEAERLVLHRPQAILDNRDPAEVPPPPGLVETSSDPEPPPEDQPTGIFRRLAGWFGHA